MPFSVAQAPARRRNAALLLAAAAVVVAVMCSATRVSGAAAQQVIEQTFDEIKNTNAEQMVAFYHSSDPKHRDALKAMRKAAKKLRNDMPHFRFRKCDCDLEANKKECNDASFHSGTFLFTSTENEGIEKYGLDVNAKTIARYLRLKKADHNRFDDVLPFSSEDAFWERMDLSDAPKPIFVKFYEQWCAHCKRAKLPFAQGATHFKDRVDFMEVECSKNDDTTAFCTRNGVKSYPTFTLFTGEQKVPFTAEVRHIMTFEKFFAEHVPATANADADTGKAAATDDAAKAKAKAKPTAATAVPPPPMGDFAPTATASAPVAAAAAAPAPAAGAGASADEVAALKRQVKELEVRLAKVEAMLRS